MRRVKYDNPHEGKGEGTFHSFGVDYEEFYDTGVGMWTTAIIEKDDGKVITVRVNDITFLTNDIVLWAEEPKKEEKSSASLEVVVSSFLAGVVVTFISFFITQVVW